jgi:hypothetical protein
MYSAFGLHAARVEGNYRRWDYDLWICQSFTLVQEAFVVSKVELTSLGSQVDILVIGREK